MSIYYNQERYLDTTMGDALFRVMQTEGYVTRKQFYHSMEWVRTRRAYIDYRNSIDGGMCEVCHNELGKVVHHKVWLTDENLLNKDIALNFNNFKYECQTCHNQEKNPDAEPSTGRRDYYFDELGNIIRKTK